MRSSYLHFDRDFTKAVLRIAIPITLQQILSSSLALVDSLMVGSIGEYELAAVGMAGQFINLFYGFCWSIQAGAMLFFPQFWGAKDMNGIRKTASIMFSSTLLLTLIFAFVSFLWPMQIMGIYTNDPHINAIGAKYLRIYAIGYLANIFAMGSAGLLRSTENVKLPLFAGVASLVTNTLLNWILIYGKCGLPALGVEGAAIASVAAAFVNLAILVLVSIRHQNVLLHGLKQFYRIDRTFLPTFFHKAAPIIINDIAYWIAVLVMNMVLGRQGADNLSALAIFRTVEGFGSALHVGLASAAAVIVGKKVGSGETASAVRDARRLSFVNPFVTFFSASAIFAARRWITSLYSIGPAVQEVVYAMLFIYIFGCTLRLVNFNFVGIYRAGGDSKIGMYLEVGGIWIVGVTLVSLTGLVLHAPFLVVFSMLYAEEVAKIGIETWYFMKNKWIKPVTPEGQEGLRQFLAEKQATQKKEYTA